MNANMVGRLYGDSALWTSETIPPTPSPSCVAFKYYLTGDATLNVWLMDNLYGDKLVVDEIKTKKD